MHERKAGLGRWLPCAKVPNDKKNQGKAGVKLVVPTLEKVGPLRQSSTPEAGRSYWMAFANNGRVVKKVDRVDSVIGEASKYDR
jgi:hypothetical protein